MKKNQKRRIAVIFELLRNRPLKQQEIEHKINQDNFLEDDEKVDGGKLSHVLKSLTEDDIIEKKPIMPEGKGAPPMASRLKKDQDTLIKVLREFNDPELDISGFFQRRLILSPYAQELINNDLLKIIELNICKLLDYQKTGMVFNFTDEENELILNILRSSPSALYYALVSYKIKTIQTRIKQLDNCDDSVKEQLKAKIINEIKKQFILNLQLKLGEDLNRNIIKFNKPIEYRISTEFLDDIEIGTPSFQQINQNEKTETIITRSTYEMVD